QQYLGTRARRAVIGGVHDDALHYFKKYSCDGGRLACPAGGVIMPAPLKTQAIVLRSIRYGEADRILHLYTPHHGRIGAIAKGARRARSRFGARLEPCFHVLLVL